MISNFGKSFNDKFLLLHILLIVIQKEIREPRMNEIAYLRVTILVLQEMIKDIIKFSLKAGVALFIIGVGTKLGKDAIENLRDIQEARKISIDGRG